MKKLPISRNEFKEIELPTFIDMVFLLLVFFIVNLSLSTEAAIPVPPPEIELPQVTGNAATLEGGKISTLTLQIQKEKKDDPQARKVLYVLRPNATYNTEKEVLADIKTRLAQTPPDCSQCAVFNRNFLSLKGFELNDLRAFKLIRESVKEYRDQNLNSEDISNTIEIIADAGTEFKIINFIFQQCQDDTVLGIPRSIPKITFRVMPPDNSTQPAP